jgi:hypothetical protein
VRRRNFTRSINLHLDNYFTVCPRRNRDGRVKGRRNSFDDGWQFGGLWSRFCDLYREKTGTN